MNRILRPLALALAAGIGMGSAHAGVLSYQNVVFTTSWANNVLTLEIDAAGRSGDWTRATMLGALSLKDIGSFTSVSVTAAPKGVGAWTLSARELNAKGCAGGGAGRTSTNLCLSGAPIALTDDMVFRFAFTGTPSLDEPHLKVSFLDSANRKTGSLLSKNITAAGVVAVPSPAPAPAPAPAPVSAPTPVPATAPLQEASPAPVAPPVPVVTASAPATPVASDSVVTPPGAGDFTPVLTPQPEPLPTSTTAPLADAKNAEVPEPQSVALLLAGLGLMGLALRKRT